MSILFLIITGREPRIGAKFQAVLPALRSRKCKRLRNRSDLADIFYRCVESVHGELGIAFLKFSYDLLLIKVYM